MQHKLPCHRYFQELNNMVLQIEGTSVVCTSVNRTFLFKHYFVQFLTAFVCEMTYFLRHRAGQITEPWLLLFQHFIMWHFNCISLSLAPSNENNWYSLHFFDEQV